MITKMKKLLDAIEKERENLNSKDKKFIDGELKRNYNNLESTLKITVFILQRDY